MGMGTNALVEQMVKAGVCDDIDHKNCIKALAKLIGMGEKGKTFAERIMGEEFEQWRSQYKTAWEEFERKDLTGLTAVETDDELSGLTGTVG